MTATRDTIQFFLNGQPVVLGGDEVFQSLSTYLRRVKNAAGTKVVCEEGDCGACSVLLGRENEGQIRYRAVNACIQYLYQLDLSHVVTVEGLTPSAGLNAVQMAMRDCHGAQCGYCTPGFVVTLCALAEEACEITPEQAKNALTGNLCRCTGYEPIIRAACNLNPSDWVSLDSQFPPEPMLSLWGSLKRQSVVIETSDRAFYSPLTLAEASVRIGESLSGTKVVQGGTDVHVAVNKRGVKPRRLVSLNLVEGLADIVQTPTQIGIGAATRLSDIEAFCEAHYPAFYEMLLVYGSPQIKNAGTLAGNITNGSPIGDSLPFLSVMNAEIELVSTMGERRVPFNGFYTGYKQTVTHPDELISRIWIARLGPDETLRIYKTSRRKHMDISTFSAAFWMTRSPGGDLIESIRVAYGGVGPTVLRLPSLEAFLTGKPWALETFESAQALIEQDIAPIGDVRGSADNRWQLARNHLLKFYWDLTEARESRPVVPV